MTKTIFKGAFIATVSIGLFSGVAMADFFNTNRPFTGFRDNSELSLQEVFNEYTDTGSGAIDAVTGQSTAALWTQDEGDVSIYKIVALFGNKTANLGIYSDLTGYKYDLTSGTDSAASFLINNKGALWIDDVEVDVNFGSIFGFYYGTTFTEDSKNGGKVRALSYLVREGTTVETMAAGGTDVSAKGNNDWILAFEAGSDKDFQDGVFYIEDMSPVPEPGTMLLFGTGLVGLVGLARRRKK